jgi:hypothetical protein
MHPMARGTVAGKKVLPIIGEKSLNFLHYYIFILDLIARSHQKIFPRSQFEALIAEFAITKWQWGKKKKKHF